MESKPRIESVRNNPVFAFALAISLAAVMFLISFLTYYHSDTRRTIERIQVNTQTLNKKSSVYDPTQAVTTQSLEILRQNIDAKISAHKDEVDYSPNELTDSALGL
jgi:hypothetical protein